MASAEHLKALLRSHADGDDERFFSIAMQIAAHEAKLGHGKLAQGLREIIDESKNRRIVGKPRTIASSRDGIRDLLEQSSPKSRLSDMILKSHLTDQIARVVREQRHAARILAHGLTPRCKLLLIGPPGTGKTLTASVLAGELHLPLLQVRLDSLITRFMGETAAKLRQVFNSVGYNRGVYLFDEFDAIGSQRSLTNDVGEIRRVLNSFLLMLEQDNSHSIIIAATNYPLILDTALFRRFDDVLRYELPSEQHIVSLLRMRLERFSVNPVRWDFLAERSLGLSHAEVSRAANEVLKEALVHQRPLVRESDILRMLEERIGIAESLAEPDLTTRERN